MVSLQYKNYVDTHFNSVWGFVDSRIPDLLLKLFSEIPLTHGVAEIGVYHGKFFLLLRHLLESNRPSLALDIFESQELNIDHSGGGDPTDSFFKNINALDPFGGDGIHIVKGNSTSTSIQDLVTDYYSIFSVDGGHTKKHCLIDLNLAQEKTVDNGIIIVDDFFRVDWPGVTEGVFDYLKSNAHFVPFLYAFNKLFLCHFILHDDYSKKASSLFPGKSVFLSGFQTLLAEGN